MKQCTIMSSTNPLENSACLNVNSFSVTIDTDSVNSPSTMKLNTPTTTSLSKDLLTETSNGTSVASSAKTSPRRPSVRPETVSVLPPMSETGPFKRSACGHFNCDGKCDGYSLGHSPIEVPRKRAKDEPLVSDIMLKYFVENNITDMSHLFQCPLEETSRFFCHPRFNSLSHHFFNIVKQRMRYIPMSVLVPAVSFSDMRFVYDKSFDASVSDRMIATNQEFLCNASPIYEFLRKNANWEHNQILRFGNCIQKIFDKENGKKNALVLIGPSNSGKSQLLRSLLDFLCPRGIARPNNNPRDVFQFSTCLNSKAIFWEEPYITADNIETVKLILGGDSAAIQVKYQDPQFLDQTPVFITSNRQLHAKCVAHESELTNRIERFFLNANTKETKGIFPLDPKLWLTFLTLCSFKLRERAFTTENGKQDFDPRYEFLESIQEVLLPDPQE